MARHAIIEQSTGHVLNVCEWDGDETKWKPDPGCFAVRSDVASPGDAYDGVTFTRPEPTPQPPKSEAAELVELLVSEGVLDQAKADEWVERRRSAPTEKARR